MTTPRDVALLRLAAQRIAGPGFATAAEAARWLTAAQAQDYPGALTSLALRTAGRTRAGVEAALDAGEVVRSWPMRGTLHLVAAEDLRWILDLTSARILVWSAPRRAELGLDADVLARAERLAVDALSGGRRLLRDELLAVWDRAGLLTPRQRGYHLVFHLALTGVLCYGPVRGRGQELVLVEEWLPAPRRLDRDEALGELALRYFRGHGPATARDFGWWAKLLAADARTGLTVAAPRLERIEVDGVAHYMAPETPDLLAAHRRRASGVFLLPGFDEFVLGYQDRGAALPAEFAGRIVPGNNGIFLPTVVAGGRIVGTWKRVGRGRNRTVLATPFTSFTARVRDAVPRVFDTLPLAP